MTIAFVHPHKAFLPEIEAYTRFFSEQGFQCEVTRPEEVNKVPHRVAWHFMGLDRSPAQRGIFKIHEYGSLSMPPFQLWKDLGKRLLNSQPDLRIFLNGFVQRSFGFTDNVPHCFRDMGISADWLTPASTQDKTFDFIYVGDLSPSRKPELLLNAFTQGDLAERSLLVLGKDYQKLQQPYAHLKNIVFEGPVPRPAVKEYIQRARFALNYIPDRAPFNQLTSTKLLEYAACRVPIISTDYAWIRQFEQQYGGSYCYLAPDLSNFTWEHVTQFDYTFPDLSTWTWEQQIRQSGILDMLTRI